jgi:hypothetical protein
MTYLCLRCCMTRPRELRKSKRADSNLATYLKLERQLLGCPVFSVDRNARMRKLCLPCLGDLVNWVHKENQNTRPHCPI